MRITGTVKRRPKRLGLHRYVWLWCVALWEAWHELRARRRAYGDREPRQARRRAAKEAREAAARVERARGRRGWFAVTLKALRVVREA